MLLTGCVAQDPGTPPSPSQSASTPMPTPTSADGAPVLRPDGTAEDNLPLFASVVAAVWATPQQVQGRAYIDALVAAGFDKAAMEVTNDQSTVGNPAESIQFSVQWADSCLMGQVGPATGEPVAVVMPALPTGGCLIGKTRPIDW